jgi:23S rRNA-/tRNA-specific pseudouridylate synthase
LCEGLQRKLEAFAFLTYLRPMNRKTVDAPGTLLDFLVSTCGFATNTRARKSIKAGEISVDGVPLRIPSAALAPGQKVAWGKPSSKDFAVPPIRSAAATRPARAPQAAEPPFEIVHEDEHLIAYIKPAGWVFASPRPQVKSAYSRMREWLASEGSPQAAARRLYQTTLCRDPSSDELAAFEDRLAAKPDQPIEALEDLCWAVLNSSEFLFNH